MPLPQPQQLVAVYNFDKQTSHYVSSSYPDFEDFSKRNRSFQHLSAYVRLPLNLSVGEATERISVEAVSADYFSMLELPPLAGRAFGAEESESPLVMLSEELWLQRFGADKKLIGKTIALEGSPLTVIGIVPARYRGVNLNWGDPPQAWMPLGAVPQVLPRFKKTDIFHRRSARWLVMFGRLRTGVTVSQAEADLRLIAGNLAKAEPATNRDITVSAFSASRSKFWPAYRSSITQLLVMFGASAGLLLLLSCANVSNLLLERAVCPAPRNGHSHRARRRARLADPPVNGGELFIGHRRFCRSSIDCFRPRPGPIAISHRVRDSARPQPRHRDASAGSLAPWLHSPRSFCLASCRRSRPAGPISSHH